MENISSKKTVSLVIPIYNEQDNIPILYQQLVAIMDQLQEKYSWECIFVNDGSNDNSWNCIAHLHNQDDRIKALSFTRNFGYQKALTAGHDYAKGDAVITLDADLQDPPELIYSMITKWENGYHIVYGKRSSRNDGFLKDVTAYAYYMILSWISDIMIPRNVGDFRLLDRKVVDTILQCREQDRYWRGLVAWTGYKSIALEFVRPERIAGQTGYTWKKLFKLAFDGITCFSLFPLHLAFYFGTFLVVTGICMMGYMLYDTVLYSVYYPLYKWMAIFIYVNMGFQCIFLWLMGYYVGTFYSVQKNRPAYIIEDCL